VSHCQVKLAHNPDLPISIDQKADWAVWTVMQLLLYTQQDFGELAGNCLEIGVTSRLRGLCLSCNEPGYGAIL
jgi:hypothetical protein